MSNLFIIYFESFLALLDETKRTAVYRPANKHFKSIECQG